MTTVTLTVSQTMATRTQTVIVPLTAPLTMVTQSVTPLSHESGESGSLITNCLPNNTSHPALTVRQLLAQESHFSCSCIGQLGFVSDSSNFHYSELVLHLNHCSSTLASYIPDKASHAHVHIQHKVRTLPYCYTKPWYSHLSFKILRIWWHPSTAEHAWRTKQQRLPRLVSH